MADNDIQSLAPGTVIFGEHRYIIERVLGAGGFGITYLASTEVTMGNIRFTGHVAIKEHFMSLYNERDGATGAVTTPGTSKARELVGNAIRDFLGEARRLQQLGAGHPNIVKVNEVFEANGTAYYVMEYLDGSSLWKAVDGQPMAEADMLALMLPVVDAVAYLHRNRLTHLDIKPQNIMLAADGNTVRPVLIDFGLSKHYDAAGNATSTINTLACSDGYSPAEQYSGITTFTPSADVYALGATMLACLVGQTPPKSTEWTAGDRMRYLDTLPVSPALRDALRGALADGSARFPDAAALLAALGGAPSQAMERRFSTSAGAETSQAMEQRFLCKQSASRLVTSAPDQAISNSAPTHQLPSEYPTSKPIASRRSLVIIAAAILASLLVLTAAAYLIFGGHTPEPTPNTPPDSTLIAENRIETPERQPARAEAEACAPSPDPTAEAVAAETAARAEQERLDREREEAEARERQQREEQERLDRERRERENRLWDSHRRAENLYIAVQRDSHQYFFSQRDWNALSASQQAECRKLGVVIKDGRVPAYILALEDEPGEYIWQEAMNRFGNRLPSKEESSAWISQQEAVQNAVRSFGGHMPGPSDKYYSNHYNRNYSYHYWTRTENGSNSSWVIPMDGGFGRFGATKDALRPVRLVTPVTPAV